MSKKEITKSLLVEAGINKAIANVIVNGDILFKERAEYFLRAIGMPEKNNGFKFWVFALELYHRILEADKSGIVSITKEIYPAVAAHFKTSAPAVERSCRNSVESVFTTISSEMLEILFPNVLTEKKRPENKSFMVAVNSWLEKAG